MHNTFLDVYYSQAGVTKFVHTQVLLDFSGWISHNKATFLHCFPVTDMNYCICLTDLTWSLIGTIVWTAIVITWVTIFQVKRVEWGQTGDRLSFIIPKGML